LKYYKEPFLHFIHLAAAGAAAAARLYAIYLLLSAAAAADKGFPPSFPSFQPHATHKQPAAGLFNTDN
jgi:hypothetical protein